VFLLTSSYFAAGIMVPT